MLSTTLERSGPAVIIRLFMILCLGTVLLTLSGCLYPGGQNEIRQISHRESVDRIQRAIAQFQADKEILPIITAGEEVPRYEKFRINLDQLKQEGYLEEIPNTAFEQGGSAYYIVIHEETSPVVKVMDLPTIQKVNDVQRLVSNFVSANAGKLPAAGPKELYPGLYEVDLQQIKGEQYAGQSVYSGEPLQYIMDSKGQVYLDYAYDIMQALDRSDKQPGTEDDLREILVEQSYYAPVKSLPYQWVNGVPTPTI